MLKGLLGKNVDRRAGDVARRARDWRGAEQSYRRHLKTSPRDADIWVQLGHAVKEQGDLAQAAVAYQTAVDLRPHDGETWLHLGYVLMQSERNAEAMTAFLKSHEVSGGRDAYEQAVSLGGSVAALPAPDRAVTTFLLLDDLFKFLADHVTLSGIQRTQVGIMSGLLQKDTSDYNFVLTSASRNLTSITFWTVPVENIRELIDYITSGVDMQRDTLDAILNKANEASRRTSFKAGDIVFVPGAFWIIEKTAATLAALKSVGAKIGVYCYDLIPISHPEFCHPFLVEQFTRSFTEMIQFVDFFATISEYVAQVLAEFIRSYGLRPIPITPIPLAHFLTIPDINQPASDAFIRSLPTRVRDRPYALYVSTIEGRKNHLYVLSVWQELLRRGLDMPELVFLGRKGWRIEGLQSFLEATDNLNGRVHFVHDIGDGDLAHLYRNCDFTLFTSLVEGWGLPVGESLVFGKPCVASNNCSIPEVGGDLVDYVDPFNLRTGLEVIERMATDPAYRAERARAIVENFRPRGWGEVSANIELLIKQAHASPAIDIQPFAIPPGRHYSVLWRKLDMTDLSNLLEFPNRLVLGDDFYDQEVNEVWMRGLSGVINIPTTLPAGAAALVAVAIGIRPGETRSRFALSPLDLDEASRRRSARLLSDRPGMPLVATVTVPVGEGGIASVRLDVFDAVRSKASDERHFHIGVRSLAYAEAGRTSDGEGLLGCFVDEVSFDAGHTQAAAAGQ